MDTKCAEWLETEGLGLVKICLASN